MYYIETLGSHLKTSIIMFGFHCICSLSDYSVAGIRLSVLGQQVVLSKRMLQVVGAMIELAPLIHMMEERRMEKLNLPLIQNKVPLQVWLRLSAIWRGEGNSTINDGSNWSHASRMKQRRTRGEICHAPPTVFSHRMFFSFLAQFVDDIYINSKLQRGIFF